MKPMSWDDVLVLDLRGRDLVQAEKMPDTICRGPISGVRADGDFLIFHLLWVAVWSESDKHWRLLKQPSQVDVKMALTTAENDRGNITIHLGMPLMQFVICRPGDTLDSMEVMR